MEKNPISPRSLRYLLAIAECRSFTRAAEALYISQPALSQQIKHLEESLEIQLVDRTGRTVRLTDAGEVYVRYARRALVELDAGKRAIHQLQDMSSGSLRLGMTPVTEYMAAPLLEDFSRRYPAIRVTSLEMSQNDIEAALTEDQLDLGIAFTNVLAIEARSSDIEAHILFVEPLHLAVGESHYSAGHSSLSGLALEEMPLAFLNSRFALRRHIDLYCLEYGITPNIAVETNSISVIVEMVRRGRLATVLPKVIASAQGLYPVMLLPELPHHTITLISRKAAYKSPACLAFAELASEWGAQKEHATPNELTSFPHKEANKSVGGHAHGKSATERKETASGPTARKARMAATVSSESSS